MWRHALAIDFGVHHDAGEIVLWSLQPIFTEGLGISKYFERNIDQVFKSATKVWVASAKNDVCPIKDLFFVALRDAHHLTNDLQRKWRGNVLDKVKLGVTKLFNHGVNNSACFDLDVFFDARDFFRCKTFGHNGSQSHMLWVVHADHRPKKFIQLNREIGDIYALAALK